MSSPQLRLAVGIILVLSGIVWLLQGLDVAFAPQSFMTNDRWWSLWGGIAVVLGAGLIWSWHKSKDAG